MILKHNGIVSKVAHELGINPREIYALAEKYPILRDFMNTARKDANKFPNSPMSRRHHDREEE